LRVESPVRSGYDAPIALVRLPMSLGRMRIVVDIFATTKPPPIRGDVRLLFLNSMCHLSRVNFEIARTLAHCPSQR
jgi:hypothetical protein